MRNKEKGFALIAAIIAIAIIAVIYFGAGKWKGEVRQKAEVKQKATEELDKINDNLKQNNQAVDQLLNEDTRSTSTK